MAGPYDYTIPQPDIAGSIAGGLQTGLQLGAAAQSAEAKKLALQQQQQYSEDLQMYLQNPTARGASAMMAKYPESQEALSASFDVYNKDQKDQIFKAGTEAYSAIKNGRPDVAMSIIDERIAAAENTGQDASDLISLKQSLERNPSGTGAGLALTMSALNPDAWGKIASEQRESEMAPYELTESQAKAVKAATDAKFAESKAVQDLEKGGWQIQKLANDINISKLNSQIAAMNAATARQGNDLKGQSNNLKLQELQLKVQDKIAARDKAVQEKAAEVTSARGSIDNFLNTADRVLQTDPDVISSAAGPVSSKIPTFSEDTADFEELLNTLSSQAFMSQIPAMKGLGALSEKEGDKLQTSLQNLSLRQSPERLMENVKEAQRLILKSRETLSKKFGVPDVTPDTPAAAPSPTGIDALLQKYGGAQ